MKSVKDIQGHLLDLIAAADKQLSEVFLDQVLTYREVFTVSENATVVEAYQLLSKHKVSSLPVVDSNGRCVGLLDYLDLLQWLTETIPDAVSIHLFMKNEKIKDASISNILVKHILNESGRDTYVPSYFDKLKTSILHFGVYKQHRYVAVDSTTGAPTCVFSQSLVMKYLLTLANEKKNNPVERLSLVSLSQLNEYLGSEDIISLPESATLADAIKLMASKRVSGIAVLSEKGELLHNMSASDLKRLYDEDFTFDLISMKLSDFLKNHKAVTVSLDNTVQDVMNRFVGNSERYIHRVYLVSDERKPSRVITLSDIISLFFYF